MIGLVETIIIIKAPEIFHTDSESTVSWDLIIIVIMHCLITHRRILPLGIAIYIVAGMLIMKFCYNAAGTDVIPNKNFWMEFPLLIKVSKKQNLLLHIIISFIIAL